jgi:hypothetical protein
MAIVAPTHDPRRDGRGSRAASLDCARRSARVEPSQSWPGVQVPGGMFGNDSLRAKL